MTDMVDLKRRKTDPEDKEFFRPPEEQPDYYPITLWLGKVEVDSLGLASVEVGKEFDMKFHVRVVSRSNSESDDGHAEKNLTLAVKSGCVVKGEKEANPDDVAAKLYDNKDTE